MLFNSYAFLFLFLPVTLLIYILLSASVAAKQQSHGSFWRSPFLRLVEAALSPAACDIAGGELHVRRVAQPRLRSQRTRLGSLWLMLGVGTFKAHGHAG